MFSLTIDAKKPIAELLHCIWLIIIPKTKWLCLENLFPPMCVGVSLFFFGYGFVMLIIHFNFPEIKLVDKNNYLILLRQAGRQKIEMLQRQ